MKKKIIIPVLLLAAGLAACAPQDLEYMKEKPERESSECEILSFRVGDYEATIDGERIEFIVGKDYKGDFKFTTGITVSDGAAVEPEPGAGTDLSQPAEYTVTAQDGAATRTYTVSVIRAGEGLYVNGGLLMRDGRPFYAVGVNYFDLFYRAYILNGPIPVGLEGLQALADKGITAVRFLCAPYWPIEWTNSYLTNKNAYYAELDKVIAKAEESGVGLIPCFSCPSPDLTGEHWNRLSDPGSQSIAFIRDYVREVVERYKDSPAILGWECSNEFSLLINLPNGQLGIGTTTYVELGQPASRDPELDLLTQAEMQCLFEVFVEAVRASDATRPVFSGNSEPRQQAYNNLFYGTWTKDTAEQFKYMLELNESKMNTLTVHTYYGAPGATPPLSVPTIDRWLAFLMRCSRELKKPLFDGEFGVASTWFDDPALERQAVEERVNGMVNSKVQLSCWWNYDRAEPDEWSFSATDSRAYILDILADANRRINE